MRAYVISLHSGQSSSNAALSDRLSSAGLEVVFVGAIFGPSINAKTYFSAIHSFFMERGRLMTPSELGCTLSHKKAYDAILNSGDPYAFIFEDDAIIDEVKVEHLTSLVETKERFGDYLHLGGQEGLRNNFIRVRGELINESPFVFRVKSDDIAYVQRTVAYMISRESAAEITKLVERNVFPIDDFEYIKVNTKIRNFTFCNLVSHPVDLSASTIEKERISIRPISRGPGLFARIFREIRNAAAYWLSVPADRLNARQKIVNQLAEMGTKV